MKTFIKKFSDSAKELTNVRSLAVIALLIALHAVLTYFMSIAITDSLKLSVSFVVNVVIGYMFGPVVGLVSAAAGDLIGFVLKPTGPFFIGWTISASLAGLIYGIAFYNKAPAVMTSDINDQDKKQSTLCKALLWAIPVAQIVLWFTVPFVRVTDNETQSVFEGTGFGVLKSFISGEQLHNMAVVSGIVVALSIVLLVLNIFKKATLSMFITVIMLFTYTLAVYTDKKTTLAMWGFWVIFALYAAYAVIRMYETVRMHNLDFSYLVRCTVAMAIVCIGINALLGTYWISIMYGKGFGFYFTARFIKNMLQLPVNVMLAYYAVKYAARIKKAVGFTSVAAKTN